MQEFFSYEQTQLETHQPLYTSKKYVMFFRGNAKIAMALAVMHLAPTNFQCITIQALVASTQQVIDQDSIYLHLKINGFAVNNALT